MDASDQIYWTFSSAAQAVAAFVGFLLAGYALVYSMMESAAQADETLEEIHGSLKKKYHRLLSRLVVVTAAAIVLSLATVLLNGSSELWYPYLAVTAGLLILTAIAGGVGFVITIVDPAKYQKAARALAREVKPGPHEPEAATPAEFFEAFVALERLLRDLWERHGPHERLRRRQGPPSFREMLDALSMIEVLPPHLLTLLQEVNRYRNLVFHGHVREVDPHVLDEVRDALAQLQRASEGESRGSAVVGDMVIGPEMTLPPPPPRNS